MARKKSAKARLQRRPLPKLRASSHPLSEPLQSPQTLPRVGVLRKILAAQQRERLHILSATSRIKGLMPLLMKRRNGSCWTRTERAELHEQLQALMHLSPYLLVLALPGSFALLPVLAWWLDRRRLPRRDENAIVEKAILSGNVQPAIAPSKDT